MSVATIYSVCFTLRYAAIDRSLWGSTSLSKLVGFNIIGSTSLKNIEEA